jgi:uncharacterized membrane protein YhaH (DUF805 family)
MKFSEAVKNGFRLYGDPEGKASRSEFWYFFLFITTIWWVVYYITYKRISSMEGEDGFAALGYWLRNMFYMSIGLGIPALTAATRRLHDMGRSGKSLGLLFIPLLFIPNALGDTALTLQTNWQNMRFDLPVILVRNIVGGLSLIPRHVPWSVNRMFLIPVGGWQNMIDIGWPLLLLGAIMLTIVIVLCGTSKTSEQTLN